MTQKFYTQPHSYPNIKAKDKYLTYLKSHGINLSFKIKKQTKKTLTRGYISAYHEIVIQRCNMGT